MTEADFNTPQDALLYLADCNVATAVDFLSLKRGPAAAAARACDIARISLRSVLKFGGHEYTRNFAVLTEAAKVRDRMKSGWQSAHPEKREKVIKKLREDRTYDAFRMAFDIV